VVDFRWTVNYLVHDNTSGRAVVYRGKAMFNLLNDLVVNATERRGFSAGQKLIQYESQVTRKRGLSRLRS
jgi:hypothetical protein